LENQSVNEKNFLVSSVELKFYKLYAHPGFSVMCWTRIC